MWVSTRRQIFRIRVRKNSNFLINETIFFFFESHLCRSHTNTFRLIFEWMKTNEWMNERHQKKKRQNKVYQCRNTSFDVVQTQNSERRQERSEKKSVEGVCAHETVENHAFGLALIVKEVKKATQFFSFFAFFPKVSNFVFRSLSNSASVLDATPVFAVDRITCGLKDIFDVCLVLQEKFSTRKIIKRRPWNSTKWNVKFLLFCCARFSFMDSWLRRKSFCRRRCFFFWCVNKKLKVGKLLISDDIFPLSLSRFLIRCESIYIIGNHSVDR